MRHGKWALWGGILALVLGVAYFWGATPEGVATSLKRIWAAWAPMITLGAPAPDGGETAQGILAYDPAIDACVRIGLEDYVLGVLAAEMPASFEDEALKAQAVAARTRALAGSCARAPDAQVCFDSAHCQGYLSETARRERWGGSFDVYETKLRDCVLATAGETMTYEGAPITVLYHAASGGHTEDCAAVFSQSLPYLRGVDSPWDADAELHTQSFTAERAAVLLKAALGGAFSLGDVRAMRVSERAESGRPLNVRLGARDVPASKVRQALSLRSAWFELNLSGDTLTFLTRGYGHGVGMSQRGAQGMALEGADYRRILSHYYTDIQIE